MDCPLDKAACGDQCLWWNKRCEFGEWRARYRREVK